MLMGYVLASNGPPLSSPAVTFTHENLPTTAKAACGKELRNFVQVSSQASRRKGALKPTLANSPIPQKWPMH